MSKTIRERCHEIERQAKGTEHEPLLLTAFQAMADAYIALSYVEYSAPPEAYYRSSTKEALNSLHPFVGHVFCGGKS